MARSSMGTAFWAVLPGIRLVEKVFLAVLLGLRGARHVVLDTPSPSRGRGVPRHVVLGALLGVTCVGAAGAHEFFVIPRVVREYKPGDVIQLDVLSTHYFMRGEEIPVPADLNDVYVLQSGVKTPLFLTANQSRLMYETRYTLRDTTPAVLVGNRRGVYYCVFTDGTNAMGRRAEVAQQYPGKSIARGHYYAQFSKTYLTPDLKDNTFKTPLGHDLEIVPLTNPAAIARGKNAEFQVLYKGQPLGGAEVSATYDTFDPATANRYALTETAKQSGRVRFKISNSGLWLVRVRDARRGESGVDVQELLAVVVFAVK